MRSASPYRPYLLVALAVLAGCAGDAEPPKQSPAATLQQLDVRIGKLLADAGVPGAGLAVIEGGAVVWTRGYGHADLASKTPVTPETIFRAGSISKSFTAIGVAMLAEEGKLDLDAPLARLLPEVRFHNPWEATDPVRLVHVIEHTAGFDDLALEDYLREGGDVPLARAVEITGPYRSRWRPGTMMSYSNPGPVIAGLAIERASGQRFEDFMAQRLLGPLGMTDARWTREPSIAPRLSRSYRDAGGTEERFVEIIDRPSGSLNVTPGELARLPLLMLGRGTLDGRTYFSAATADRIERPVTTDAARAGFAVGYGLGNSTQMGGKAVWHGHDGAIDGFLAMSHYAPAIGAGFVLMLNRIDPVARDIADEIRSYLERAVPAVAAPAARPLRGDEITAYAGFYQSVTPRNQLFAPVDGLIAWLRVRADANGLRIGEDRYVAVGEGLFQRVGGPAPEVMIRRDAHGRLLLDGLAGPGNARKLAALEFVAKVGGIGALLLTMLLGAGHALVWVVGAFRGRLAGRGGLSIRLLPGLAVMSAMSVPASLMIAESGGMDTLGTPSWPNLLLWAATVALPLLGPLALWRAWRGAPGASRFVRGMAWASGATVTGLAIYLAAHGWIGVRLWA